ncbi:MAG: 30S ribosome-binding factor RbfA [Gammaproteobacteria bacterium]|nr:30S ribosome-binding factor RbfA [Gammaproteobacteria bacterium]
MPKEYPRKLRINAQLQRELTDLIRDELTDPRVKGVTVTAVDASPDLRNAKVYVSVLALDAKVEEAVAALKHASNFLHNSLGRRLRMRYVPHLHFVADKAIVEGSRINKLIRDAVSQDKSHARERGDDSSDT